MAKLVVAATGHRPKDIDEPWDIVELKARVKLQPKASRLICGMAEGFDLLAAKAAMSINLPITVARPWNTHTVGKDWIELYTTVMGYADTIHVVVPVDTYHVSHFFKRNEWMVDHADAVMAYWNPEKQSGGTYGCIQYALKKQVPVANTWNDPPF